jgi:hypothetical protein
MTRILGLSLAVMAVVLAATALVLAAASSPSWSCREFQENGQVTSCTVRP